MRVERILWWCVLGSRPRHKISFSGEGCLWIWHPLEERIGYHGATQVGEKFSMHFRNPTWIFRTSTSYPQKDVVFSPWTTFSIGIDCVFRCLLKRDWFLPSVLHPFTFHQEIIALNRPLSHLEDDENIALFGWLLKMKLACSHPRETNGWNPQNLVVWVDVSPFPSFSKGIMFRCLGGVRFTETGKFYKFVKNDRCLSMES